MTSCILGVLLVATSLSSAEKNETIESVQNLNFRLDIQTNALSLCTRFSNFGFQSLFQTWKKIEFKTNLIFFEFELDFYCLCSLQESISKSKWFFSFLNLIFWNWKKFEWHSISQKSSGDRQGVSFIWIVWSTLYVYLWLTPAFYVFIKLRP